MHEFSIARSICRIAFEEAEKHGASCITTVCVEVGMMRQVVPELLRTAFGVASKGTTLEGAVLEIHSVPITTRCCSCNHFASCETLPLQCDNCGSNDVQFAGGNDLRVSSIRIAEEVSNEH